MMKIETKILIGNIFASTLLLCCFAFAYMMFSENIKYGIVLCFFTLGLTNLSNLMVKLYDEKESQNDH